MDHWKEIDGKLTRVFTFSDFAEAMAFVNNVTVVAEKMDHHPDIHIHYNEVTLELWTHSAGGITDKDKALAQKISELLS